MKQKFPGFYRPTAEEFSTLWKEGSFALDANVLLNLYRYPKSARDELIEVFAGISRRVWIPFQAALEFQRNRPSVIAEQGKRFQEVRNLVEGQLSSLKRALDGLQLRRRHSVISADDLISNVESTVGSFLGTLATLEEEQATVTDDDPLRDRIDQLFGDRIGDPPATQAEVDEICKEGGRRFAGKVPPGYLDANKADRVSNIYSYGGIVYPAQFGDLLVWKQIIDFARSQNVRALVFLTDDEKADWWWTVDSEGKKRLGPRPELVDEIRREARVDKFYIYNSEQFLKFSRTYLAAKVADESIQQVGEIAKLSGNARNSQAAVAAVAEWIASEYTDPSVAMSSDGFPDITVTSGDMSGVIGVEVVLAGPALSGLQLRARLNRAHLVALDRSYARIDLVCVCKNAAEADRITSLVSHVLVPTGVGLIIGALVPDSNAQTGRRFFPTLRRSGDGSSGDD